LISLRKSVNDLDRLDALQRAAVECYAAAISATEQYAIEVDWSKAAQFRAHLQTLQEKLRDVISSAQLQSIQSSFEDELRDYRDATHEKIRRLRKDVEAASAAVEVFAGSVTASSSDHEVELKRELKRLGTVAASDDLKEIRTAIGSATTTIASSFDKLRSTNQLAIIQLKDEIRVLHQQLQAERKARPVEQPAESWNQERIGARVDELLQQGHSFSLLLVVVRNLARLESTQSKTIVEIGLNSLQMRLQGMISVSYMTGRWRRDQFVAILRETPSNAMMMSRQIAQELSRAYLLQEKGASHKVVFQVSAGVLDHRGTSDSTKLYSKLEDLGDTLAGA
jgi:GGDEF domain-containing protein